MRVVLSGEPVMDPFQAAVSFLVWDPARKPSSALRLCTPSPL